MELILHSVLATPTFRHKRAACPNTLTQYMLGPKARTEEKSGEKLFDRGEWIRGGGKARKGVCGVN